MASANVVSNQTPVMPKSHVGFDSITTQIERKLLKRGFQFNIICVGGFKYCVCLRLFVYLGYRSDWIGEIDFDQHNFRVASH